MSKPMSRALSVSLMMTDVLFLAYWALSALNLIGIIHIPPDAMYSDYTQPRVVAWNWSFLPVDIVFSCLGLSAVAASRRGYAIWRPLALLSLAFTIAAGGMAISYWIILSEYNLSWFLPNLALVIWPLFFLPSLVRDTQESRS